MLDVLAKLLPGLVQSFFEAEAKSISLYRMVEEASWWLAKAHSS